MGDHAGEGCEHLAVHGPGVKPLFLEVYADFHFLKRTERRQHFLGVSGEARHGFDDDAVDQAFFAIPQHSAEVIPFFHARSGHALVCINVYKFVFGMPFTVFGVVFDLCCEGVELVGRVTRHPAVWG